MTPRWIVTTFPLLILVSGLLAQQPNTCDPILNNCDVDDSITSNTTILQNTTSIVSNMNENLELRADETTNWPIVGKETFDVYLDRYLKENPQAVVVQSKDFPSLYPSDTDLSTSISVTGGTGIEVVLHYLDINPRTDFLYFRAGTEEANDGEQGPTLTGHITDRLKYKILDNTNMFMRFKSSKNSKYIGFVLTYAPFGEMRTTVTTEAYEPTVPTVELKSFKVALEIPIENQNTDTWNVFKNLIALAVNDYTTAQNLSLATAKPSEIIMLSIQTCPPSWPNHENCINMRFAVPLPPINSGNLTLEQLLNDGSVQYQLSTEHLERMWLEYGRVQFESNGIYEFVLPNTDYMLLLWSSISAAIVVLFLVVLYSIWKMDFFRDYHRMSTKSDDKKSILPTKSDYDISMFPSPHQIVPSFFPSSEPVNNGMSHDYETHPIAYTQSDFTNQSNNDVSFSPNILNYNVESKGNRNELFQPEHEAPSKYPQKSPSPRTKQRILLEGMSKTESMS